MIDRQWLHDRGFVGFVGLRSGRVAELPRSPGVYAVLRENSASPGFLAQSVGGHFKGKNPTVAIEILERAWIPNCQVVYIGKAGKLDRRPSIQRRIGQYLNFGSGRAVAHWGGRYIWQLEDSAKLIFAWRETPGCEPKEIESRLLAEIWTATGKLPFANLRR